MSKVTSPILAGYERVDLFPILLEITGLVVILVVVDVVFPFFDLSSLINKKYFLRK